MMNYLDLSS